MVHDPHLAGRRRFRRPGFVAVAVAASMVAGFLTPATPARAEEMRPPRSANLGLVPANVATDVIPTDILISPRPDEPAFTSFRITAVQMVPMTKVLRDGTVDPDHAIAEWFFTFGFPRSSAPWPPFLPEPTQPWRFHFFEMPDAGITGVGPEPGSPLYTPPTDLPADWLLRLVPAARAAIPAAVFEAAIAENLVQALLGGIVAVPPAVTAAFTTFLAESGATVAAGGAPTLALANAVLANVVVGQIDMQTLAAALAVGAAGLVLTAILTGHPCYSKTAQVLGLVLAAMGAMVGVSLATTTLNRALYITAALVFIGAAIAAFGVQIFACKTFVEGLYAAHAEPVAYAALVAASAFLLASGSGLLIVFVVGVGGLGVLLNWWGAGVPAAVLAMFGLG